MLAALIEMIISGLRLPRRWDGKNLSSKRTLTTSVRVATGTEPGLTEGWRWYATTIDAGHLWFGRHSVFISSVSPEQARSPQPRERGSLDRDFVVVPLTSSSGSEMEWALRASELGDVLNLLGFSRAATS